MRTYGEPDYLYIASSGNIAASYRENAAGRVALRTLWGKSATKEDESEFEEFIFEALRREGLAVASVLAKCHGGGAGAKARSIQAVREFLKMGKVADATKLDAGGAKAGGGK
jgi:hypothetical protein